MPENDRKVLVLGCGPAGLFAAHAATLAGCEVTIASKKRKSELYGAQYLHAPIPTLTKGDPFNVKYQLEGTPEEYGRKIYGPGFRGTVSPEELMEDHQGWDLRVTYAEAWKTYQSQILDTNFVSPATISGMLKMNEFAFAISTIPAPLLCSQTAHGFAATRVWAIGDAPERGIFCPITNTALNTVKCSGFFDRSWYRVSNIDGYHTAEWPENKRPPYDGVSEVIKPVSTNCDCLPDFQRVGRYGKWTKGVLSHEAFYETYYGIAGQPWLEADRG